MKRLLARPRPALIAGLFFLAGVLTRLPFRSQMLYHWDSVNFALALEHFDVRLHQPHPPGYLLYVALGWLANRLFADPNMAYAALSILFSGVAVVMLYALGRELFGEGAGLVAAVLALTSPAVWFYGEVALTYILEAGLVTALAWAAYRARRGERCWLWITTVLLAVAGGIRQTTLLLFFPLWVWVVWKEPWRIRAGAGALLGLLVLAWLVPTVALSGGLSAYLAAARVIGGGVVSGLEFVQGGQSLLAMAGPLIRFAAYLGYGLLLGALPLGYGLLWLGRRRRAWRRGWRDERVTMLGLWLLPNLLFYAPLVRAPGHTFSFLPALLLLVAWGGTVLARDLATRWGGPAVRWGVALVIGLSVVNVGFFLAAPPYLGGVRRVVTTTPSWTTIRQRDQYLAARVVAITTHFDPATTLVVTTGVDYRHPDYYLRAYPAQNCTPETVCLAQIPPGVQRVVLFSDQLTSTGDAAQVVELSDGGQLTVLPVTEGSALVLRQYEVQVQRR